MEKIFVKNASENSKVAELILEILRSKKSNILFLMGNLGAGKTTFTHTLAKLLNTNNQVSSPTFVIQKIYNLEANNYGFKNIYHLDLYRLNSFEEIEDLGLLEETFNMKNLFVIEWPEKIREKLKNSVTIKINILSDGAREFEIV